MISAYVPLSKSLNEVRSITTTLYSAAVKNSSPLIWWIWRFAVSNELLFQFASKYLPVQKPDFVNVPIPVDTPHAVVAVEQVEDGPEENFADYQVF